MTAIESTITKLSDEYFDMASTILPEAAQDFYSPICRDLLATISWLRNSRSLSNEEYQHQSIVSAHSYYDQFLNKTAYMRTHEDESVREKYREYKELETTLKGILNINT